MFGERERIGNNHRMFSHIFEYPILYSDKLFRPKIHIDILVALQRRFFEIRSDERDVSESQQPISQFPVQDDERI